MADDWEAGDLALCVNRPVDADPTLTLGRVYLVKDVFWGYSIHKPEESGLALVLEGVVPSHPDADGYGVEHFIKVGGRSVNEELVHEALEAYPIPLREDA